MCHGTREAFNESGGNIVPLEYDNPINEDLDPLIGKYFNENPRQNFHQHNPTWKCGNCLTYCPVGSWYGRFRETGLANADTDKFIDEK